MNGKSPTSLVLGSGGARGLTHIGVIRALQDRGHDIRYVSGSSIGALVGGIYAAGKLDAYADWVCALQKIDIVRLLDWSFEGDALLKGERIIAVLKELIGDRNIEDLPIGYTAVATDLSEAGKGREIWLNQGPLFDAIRASMSVPTIFTPVKRDGRLLVDGGVVNPVPVAPTLNDRTDITVAVDLNGGPEARWALMPEREAKAPGALQVVYQQRIGRYLDRLWPDSQPQTEPERLGFSDIAMRSMETMQATITKFKLAASAPTVTISIPRNLCGFFDFHRARDLIEYGYSRTVQVLDQLEDTGSDVTTIPGTDDASDG